MHRIISLLLLAVILASILLNTISCAEDENPTVGNHPDVPGESDDKNNKGDESVIVVPDCNDFDREIINFDDITYERPNADALIKSFNDTASLIEKNEIEYEKQLNSIIALEPDYINFTTMNAYATVMNSIDRSDEEWLNEYEYTNSMLPSFIQATENLFVAAAASPYCERFEDDYFGEDALLEYKDGGKYTDALVLLLEKEAALESEYSALTTATVKINFGGTLDTVDAHLENLARVHTKSSSEYQHAYTQCMALYETALSEATKDIFVELVKVRSKITKEYGYESYSELCYEEFGRDYTAKDMKSYAENISMYILPVYLKLSYSVFLPYFNSFEWNDIISGSTVINSLYALYESTDEDLKSAYAYMLECGLYNYESANENRFQGSFTTYFDAYDAPFVFISADENVNDYMTLAHEFGHFYDAYVNYGTDPCLDLAEVSSTSLELLSVLGLRESLDDKTFKYLYYKALDSAMQAMIFQSFYSLAEHYVYDIPENNINENTLSDAVKKASQKMGFMYEFSLEDILIPHTLLYPFYVQSYSTSTAVSLQILHAETDEAGAGLEIYKELIEREGPALGFEEELDDAGLTSPFDKNAVAELADTIHYDIFGSHYFTNYKHKNKAA